MDIIMQYMQVFGDFAGDIRVVLELRKIASCLLLLDAEQ